MPNVNVVKVQLSLKLLTAGYRIISEFLLNHSSKYCEFLYNLSLFFITWMSAFLSTLPLMYLTILASSYLNTCLYFKNSTLATGIVLANNTRFKLVPRVFALVLTYYTNRKTVLHSIKNHT